MLIPHYKVEGLVDISLESRTLNKLCCHLSLLRNFKSFLVQVDEVIPHGLEATNILTSTMTASCCHGARFFPFHSCFSWCYQKFTRPYINILVINRYPWNLLWQLNNTRLLQSHHLYYKCYKFLMYMINYSLCTKHQYIYTIYTSIYSMWTIKQLSFR